MRHRHGMCPECSRVVATTYNARVWRHDHIAARGTVICPGTGRPAVDIIPRQLEIPAEQLRIVDLVDEAGRLVAFGVPGPRTEDEAERQEQQGFFVA